MEHIQNNQNTVMNGVDAQGWHSAPVSLAGKSIWVAGHSNTIALIVLLLWSLGSAASQY